MAERFLWIHSRNADNRFLLADNGSIRRWATALRHSSKICWGESSVSKMKIYLEKRQLTFNQLVIKSVFEDAYFHPSVEAVRFGRVVARERLISPERFCAYPGSCDIFRYQVVAD